MKVGIGSVNYRIEESKVVFGQRVLFGVEHNSSHLEMNSD
jgi:hypothetical protein